jgi:hypothetical protein
MRKQEIVLEDDSNPAILRLHERAHGGIIENSVGESNGALIDR